MKLIQSVPSFPDTARFGVTKGRGIEEKHMGDSIKKHKKSDTTLDVFFILIGIHSMQGWTATTAMELQEKKAQKD